MLEGESRAFAEPVWLVIVSRPRKQQLSAVSSLANTIALPNRLFP